MMEKHTYHAPSIEVISTEGTDVITSSSPFDGEDDVISEWD